MSDGGVRGGSVVLYSFAAAMATAVFASDPPDARVNPASGAIETVDSVQGTNGHEVRHANNPGGGQPITVTWLSTSAADDLSPRIAIGSSGDTWVVWWRDGSTPSVIVRKRTYSSATWGSERTIGDTSHPSRNPEVAFDGSHAWIGYEESTSTGIALRAGVISDDPTPVDTVVVGYSTFGGNVDVMIHAEQGKVWLTWVDGSTYVGWSRYDTATQSWSSPQEESYAGDSVAGARGRVRASILAS